MADDYITVAELASTLSLTETFADDDMALAITAASREVERLCDRKFWIDQGLRYYTPTDSRLLFLDDLIVLTAVDVDLDGDGVFETSWTENTDFYLEPLNASMDARPWTSLRVNSRASSSYLPRWERSVRVNGRFGWPAVPDGVKQATGLIASRLLKRSREAPFGVAGFGIDGGAVRITSFDPDVNALLAQFVRHTF